MLGTGEKQIVWEEGGMLSLPKGRFLRTAHYGQRQAASPPHQLAPLQTGGQAAPAVLSNERNSNPASAQY
jgi:hypothetical protein